MLKLTRNYNAEDESDDVNFEDFITDSLVCPTSRALVCPKSRVAVGHAGSTLNYFLGLAASAEAGGIVAAGEGQGAAGGIIKTVQQPANFTCCTCHGSLRHCCDILESDCIPFPDLLAASGKL
jgi:hypothetical protein